MKQETALSILKSGHNVFLTGSAGSGKTYVLNQYIRYLRERGVQTAVTASTGIAATHLGGQTIHSWSGMGIAEELSDRDLALLQKKKVFRDRLEQVKVLIIDEISMLSGKMLQNVNRILQFFRVSFEPFGGVQVILCGDFFQLPPVSKGYTSSQEKFAFMHPVWVQSNLQVCYLTEQHRQSDDRLSRLLNQIRDQDFPEDIESLLREKQQSPRPTHHLTRLFTHNVDVDRLNQKEIQKIAQKPQIFRGSHKGPKKLIEAIQRSILAPSELLLKVGAKVMFVKNSPSQAYSNGTLGTIVRFDVEGFPVVETPDGEEIIATPVEWSINDEYGQIAAQYTQIPLRLAWAITVHKSQGMTLDEAEMDLSKTFEPGQGYVALSRVRSWEGVYLLGYNPRTLSLDPLALKADQRFQELSRESARIPQGQTPQELEKTFDACIHRMGGTTKSSDIESRKATMGTFSPKAQKTKTPKVSTYDQTKTLVEEGQTLEAMAEARGLTVNTILTHLRRLSVSDPTLDLDPYRPKETVLAAVRKAHRKLEKRQNPKDFDAQGHLTLAALHYDLKRKYDYTDIRQAMLFL